MFFLTRITQAGIMEPPETGLHYQDLIELEQLICQGLLNTLYLRQTADKLLSPELTVLKEPLNTPATNKPVQKMQYSTVQYTADCVPK